MQQTTESSLKFDPAAAVEVRDLSFKYPRSDEAVIKIDHWQLTSGSSTFIYGPSGSGKSTLLNLLAGLLVPSQGSVAIMGQQTSHLKAAQRDRFRAQHIGIIFQQFNLIPWLSVRDNISAAHYFSRDKKTSKSELLERITQLLDRLGLAARFLDRKTKELSIGQQQRVAIARALINQPALMIADEPTSALDTDARDGFMQLLLECVSEYSSTLIFVSHDKTLSNRFEQSVNLPSINLAAREGGDVS